MHLTYFIGPSEDAPTLVDSTTSAEVKISLMAFYSKNIINKNTHTYVLPLHAHTYTHFKYTQITCSTTDH